MIANTSAVSARQASDPGGGHQSTSSSVSVSVVGMGERDGSVTSAQGARCATTSIILTSLLSGEYHTSLRAFPAVGAKTMLLLS
jgi:hypothetical protein